MIVITRSLQELTLPHFLQKIEVIPTPTAMMLQHVVFHDVTTQHDATGMTTLIGPFLMSPSLLRLLLWLGTCPLMDHRLLEETSLVGGDHTRTSAKQPNPKLTDTQDEQNEKQSR